MCSLFITLQSSSVDTEHAALHYVPDVDQYIIRDLGSSTGVCVCACVRACVHVQVCMCLHGMCAYMYVSMCVSMFAWVCLRVKACVHVYVTARFVI